MTKPRANFTATLLRDGTVLTADNGATDLYNPSIGQFSATAGLPPDIDSYVAVLLADGRVLVTGGNNYEKSGDLWDPAAGFWTPTGPMFNARTSNFGLVRLNDGRVLVDGAAVPEVTCPSEGGGCTFGPVDPAEIYTP